MLYYLLAAPRQIKVNVSTQQAMQGRNGGTGISLLWLNLGARLGMDVQSHAPDDLPAEKCPGIYCAGGCVGFRVGLNGKYLFSTQVKTPKLPGRSKSLCQLRFPIRLRNKYSSITFPQYCHSPYKFIL